MAFCLKITIVPVMVKTILKLFLVAVFICCVTTDAHAGTDLPQDKKSAVILAYHRIGEDHFPDTNIRSEQFKEHIRELTNGSYHVLGLSEITAAFEKNETLPDRAVAITFDGAHVSILENAIPLLLEKELPFTVFLPTDHIDREGAPYLRWETLQKLARNKLVTLGIHPASYARLYTQEKENILFQINKARSRFRKELGFNPEYFAYPFGEYSQEYRDLIETQNFKAAFGQHSAVAYAGNDRYTLPRFSMTESYGDLSRFRLIASALPLPVTDLKPQDPYLDNVKPHVGFSLASNLNTGIDDLSCFVSRQEMPAIERAGRNRVEIRLNKALENARTRINCTLPVRPESAREELRWRWFGLLLIAPVQHAQLREYNALEDSQSPF